MKISSITIIVLLLLILSACGSKSESPAGSSDGTPIVRPDPPADYAAKTNPFAADSAAIKNGKEIFGKNCQTCHGEKGNGDGPAAASLDPKPEKLRVTVPSLTDGYLYWRISEGGAFDPFKSAMPPWKSVLNEDQIWQLISFLRSLE